MKKISNLLFILLISIFSGTLLLLAVNSLPTEKMQKHISESISVMESEGDYPELIHNYKASRLDNFTDSIMLVSSANKAPTDLIDRTINVYRVSYQGKRPPEALIAYGKGDTNYNLTSYSRYWHGYQLILKPVLLVFNYQEIRYINMCIQALTIAFITALMWNKNLKTYVFPYLIMICSLMPTCVAFSLQFSTVFYIMNIAVIILLIKFQTIESSGTISIFFLNVGITTSFFDFLTYPLVTFAIPLTIYFVLKEKNYIRNEILKVMHCGIVWVIGYGGMWAGKWCIGSLFLRKNIIGDAITAIFNRTSAETSTEVFSRKDVLIRNVSTMFETPIRYFFLIVGTILLIKILIKMIQDKKIYLKNLHFLFIATMPFCWYIIMANHSYVHFWFTYRELAIFIFAILMWLCKNWEDCKSASEIP